MAAEDRVRALVPANLETPLPPSLPAGAATALFVAGTWRGSGRPELLVDGTPQTAGAASGRFWAVAVLPARAAGDELVLTLQGAELGRIPIGAAPAAPRLERPVPPGLVAVCMATHEPDPALLRVQVESLRAQTDEHWVCVISDDASSPEAFARLEGLVGGDPRFVVSRAPERLGFYRNFERALRLAPAEAELVALCDQDDRWAPEKLAVLRAALGGAQLVYSDQRLVDAQGRVLRDTLWRGRRNNHTDLASLLVANSVTGAAALLRRTVAELALPFPEIPGLPFHDHWIGLVALTAGEVAYVDRPLYDYVQHRGAFFGAVTHGGPGARGRRRVVGGARAAYFRGYLPRVVLARTLLARCAAAPAKRRALERFVAAERSPAAAAWLAARSLRALAGRTETLGSESELIPGLVWRALAGPLRLDASLPGVLDFQQRRLRRWRARI
jgi:glycosyltransferase involved in cell wall biosynthesis